MINSPIQEMLSETAALSEAADLLPRYVEALRKCTFASVSEFKNGGLQTAPKRIGELADKLGSLVSTFTLIHRDSRRLSPLGAETEEQIKMIKIHLLSILKAVKAAEESGDLDMVVDLLEYELQDNLTQWKIRAIPKVREAIRTAKF